MPRSSQSSANPTSYVLKAPVVGPPYMASPLGAEDTQGASSQPRVEHAGRNCPPVKPWGTPTQNKTPWTQNVRNNKRIKRGGERSPTQGLAFGVRDACRAANWPLPKQCQFRPENAPLQAQKLPISKTLATTGQICRGVDMASSYLWFRDADGGCSCPACLVERREYWSPNEVAVPGPGVGSANLARS